MRLRRAVALATLLVATAHCGGDEVDPDDPTTPKDPVDPEDPVDPCPTPARLVGEDCVEPGVQDDGCPAGTTGVDGQCITAGVTPELCAEGFVHDGDRSCAPILPEMPCPSGEMALPGETSCHPVMECGTGTWGDIPVEPDTVYVDTNAGGGKGEGTIDKPFTSVTDAIAAAPEGAIVAIAAGTYFDLFLVDRSVRLWGRCPSMVRLAGVLPDFAQMIITADDVEVHGIGMQGPGGGIVMADQSGIVLDRVWLHDLTDHAVGAAQTTTPSSLTLTRSLIEGAAELGVGVFGAAAVIADTVVRDTKPDVDGNEGRGINVQRSSSGAAGALDADRVVIRGSRSHGLFVSDADLVAHRLVVLDTLGEQSDGTSGLGVLVQRTELTTAATARITSSYVARSHYFGVVSVDASIDLEGLVVDDTLPQVSDQAGGIPLAALTPSADQTTRVRSTLLQGGSSIGLSARGGGVTLEGIAIRGIGPDAVEGTGGVGLVMRTADDTTPGELTARGLHIESAGDFGVYTGGADATFEGLLMDVVTDDDGWGVFATHEGPGYLASNVMLIGSTVTGARGFGVSAFGSHVTLEGTAVQQTRASDDGTFGDGVAVTGLDEDGTVVAASALLRSSRVSDNERAGVASFGGLVELQHAAAACNVLDLTGQTFNGQTAQFEDLGANLCGCPEGSAECQVRNADVSPPQAPKPPARSDAPLGTNAPEPMIP